MINTYLRAHNESDIFLITPETYEEKYIETHRVFPLFDNTIELLMKEIIYGNTLDRNFLDQSYLGIKDNFKKPIFSKFKNNFQSKLSQSKFNNLKGLENFTRTDISLGCTQYIDSLHIKYQSNIQVLAGEYMYHRRLSPNIKIRDIEYLESEIPLIISVPFTNGSIHARMDEILDRCKYLNIKVHIDGAWITAARNINIDLTHPAIESISISMSKGYGLSGWNRIGLRWSKNHDEDLISIMNDYNQITTYSVVIGNYFLDNLSIDHLWNTHAERHKKICDDFNIVSTDSIHVALHNTWIRGIAPLIRYLEKNDV